jgi:hypothetical protein
MFYREREIRKAVSDYGKTVGMVGILGVVDMLL